MFNATPRPRDWYAALASLFCISWAAPAQTTPKISFSRDVAPILTASWMQCHGREPLMAHLDLRTRDTALKGALHGAAIVPGNAAESHLYRHLTGQELPQMPLGGRLSDAEIAIVKNWIDSGAEWDSSVTLGPGAAPASSTGKKFEQQRRYWGFPKVVMSRAPTV